MKMENSPPTAIFPSRRILVRGVNWLGDAVMATPALIRLRERFPDAHIALLTPEKLRDLWTNHPALNEIIPLVPNESVFAVARKLRRVRSSRCNDRTAQRVVPTKFDLALVLPNSPRSAIETWLAGIPHRVGYARPWRNFFLTQTVPPRAGAVTMQKRSVAEIQRLIATPNASRLTPRASAHQIHEYLHLAAALGANPDPNVPQLFVSPDEIEAAKKKFGLEKITQPVFGLNPGAEYGPAKRWPVERFIAAAREIQNRTNCLWLIFGSKADVASQRAADILSAEQNFRQDAGSTFLNLAGKTSLRELMSLLAFCRVLLTNDSGPMHVAAALGTPVVVPFGSTSPELTGPGLPSDRRNRLLKSDAPCSPCFRRECPIDFRCMNGIGVEHVVEAVLSCSGAL